MAWLRFAVRQPSSQEPEGLALRPGVRLGSGSTLLALAPGWLFLLRGERGGWVWIRLWPGDVLVPFFSVAKWPRTSVFP
jgi:hypothetical protein